LGSLHSRENQSRLCCHHKATFQMLSLLAHHSTSQQLTQNVSRELYASILWSYSKSYLVFDNDNYKHQGRFHFVVTEVKLQKKKNKKKKKKKKKKKNKTKKQKQKQKQKNNHKTKIKYGHKELNIVITYNWDKITLQKKHFSTFTCIKVA
jgi:hypothetical protein